MACNSCKKKKPITKLPAVKNEKPPRVTKKRGRPKKVVESEITQPEIKTVDEVYTPDDIKVLKENINITEGPKMTLPDNIEYNYPSVDDLKFLDFWFNSRHHENPERANKIYKMIFKEDIIPNGCRGCLSRSHRKWIAFIGEMLTLE